MDPLNDALNAALTVSSGQLAFLTLSQMPDNRAQMPSHGPRWVAEPPSITTPPWNGVCRGWLSGLK